MLLQKIINFIILIILVSLILSFIIGYISELSLLMINYNKDYNLYLDFDKKYL